MGGEAPEEPVELVGEEASEEADGDVPHVRWQEFRLRKRPRVTANDFPDAARQLGGDVWTCIVRLTIDAAGTPEAATVSECPEVFWESARGVALRYRFYPLDPPRRATVDLRVNFKGEVDEGSRYSDWTSVAFGAAGGVAPLSSVAEAWATSSGEIAVTLDMQSDVVAIGVAGGVRGSGAVAATHMTIRLTPSPVAPTLGARGGLVTGSPEMGAYLFLGLPVGVDLLPRGRFRFALGATPELDLSFTDGFAWRVGTFASVQLLREPHPAWE